jgi:general secretion pathway protein K
MQPQLGNHQSKAGREEGAVLLLVILILALISILTLSWAQAWRTELKLASNFGQVQKCRSLAEAGIFYALGKLVSAKAAELAAQQPNAPWSEGAPGDLWQGDQRLHVLELPDGKVAIRIADEGGKINLNRAPEETLRSLFTVLELPELQIRTMVDSILDWRSRDNQPRPYGAKSDYYLGLNPPYVAKNGPFETVEELAWVHGFEASPLIPRLGHWLTVQGTGQGVNLNTAPLEVLLATGIPADLAQMIMVTRQKAPFRNSQEIVRLFPSPRLSQQQTLSFKTSPFFTISATGMGKQTGGHQTIRAIVRIDVNREEPWMIYSWFDGFPG